MTLTAHHVVLPVALPLLVAFLLPLVGRLSDGLARLLAQLTTLAVAVIALLLWPAASDGGALVSAMGGFAAPIGIVFYADKLALMFVVALAVGLLLFRPRREHDSTKVQTLWLLLLAGGSGLVLSGDLFNIFVFYEITAVATYGLGASAHTGAGYGASLRYLLLSALGSAFALLGIALVYAAAGTLNLADLSQLAGERLTGPMGLTAFVLMVLGFGVKAELFPVNTWVPEVYTAAPTRVTAVLAGVVSKLAMVVILRLLVLLFQDPAALGFLLLLGAIGVAAGELAAFRSRDLHRTFAYSSIAQLGLMAVAFSIPGHAGVLAGIAVALHHLVVKPAFFVLADRWRGEIAGLTGAGRTSPLAAGLFVLLSLSIIGIPPLPGFWAKLMLFKAAIDAGGAGNLTAVAIILAATVIEAAYLFRVVGILYGTAPAGRPPLRFTLGELAPGLLLGAVLIAATVSVAPLGDGLTAMAADSADAAAYASRVLPGGN
ncbi:MAG: NADH-quinone oxidoreductase subunit J [Hyphomicrobiales bacterium]|nr:NADH-quinone oxidoreductase subunit J [Hyphomicrobiales bacterium]MCP5371296.1 NADH-quinone oxidoreductase subunit J [Hyphomicrobiales bacterium]